MAWAVLCPGQGSQSIGMGRFYYEHFQKARLLFESAGDALKINFKKLCFEGPEETLRQTENSQPAIVLVSCTAWCCLAEEMDMSFIKYCAGHSVGEYSALAIAKVLPLNTALQAVRKRGLLMSKSNNTGGMSALIGASAELAEEFCKWVEKTSSFKPLEPANFNSPEQTVLSGSLQALNWAKEHLQDFSQEYSTQKNSLEKLKTTKPLKLIPLKVSGPFHSSLMKPAGKQMEAFLNTLSFKKPELLIVQNTKAEPAGGQTQEIKRNLSKGVCQPVQWLKSMQYLFQQNCRSFLELGEGRVLAGLMKKIDPSKKVFHFHSLQDIETLKKYSAETIIT